MDRLNYLQGYIAALEQAREYPGNIDMLLDGAREQLADLEGN